MGLSRRAADVPPGERLASAWFKHEPPHTDSLLTIALPLDATPANSTQAVGGGHSPSAGTPPVAPEVMEAARGLWTKADVYYFRAMARLQKLQAAAVLPHRDISGGEATAATRLCEHALYLARRWVRIECH